MNLLELESELSRSLWFSSTSMGRMRSFELAKSRLMLLTPFPGVDCVLIADDGVSLPI